MRPAFTHCALHVCDLDQSIEFYRDYCGLEIVKEHGEGEGRVAWLATPGDEEQTSLWCCSAADRRVRKPKTT